jgi:hypothetical protein
MTMEETKKNLGEKIDRIMRFLDAKEKSAAAPFNDSEILTITAQ